MSASAIVCGAMVSFFARARAARSPGVNLSPGASSEKASSVETPRAFSREVPERTRPILPGGRERDLSLELWRHVAVCLGCAVTHRPGHTLARPQAEVVGQIVAHELLGLLFGERGPSRGLVGEGQPWLASLALFEDRERLAGRQKPPPVGRGGRREITRAAIDRLARPWKQSPGTLRPCRS